MGKDERTKSAFCHRVIAKGPTDEWALRKVIQDIEDLGRSQVILKTGGGPAIMAGQGRIISMRQAQTLRGR